MTDDLTKKLDDADDLIKELDDIADTILARVARAMAPEVNAKLRDMNEKAKVDYCPGCGEVSAWGDDLCPECLAVNAESPDP